ncbi:MAG: hypothetical protein L6R42_003689 [Xanthoria sp. 1 TBL-2021]|nr:MAG: hypothetical protein L6R42_003689 [Xanthoria sp. 1 TBL-2021]
MSRHRADWDQRSYALGRSHHGDPDPDTYRRERNDNYPGVGPGFPAPHHFRDNYSAVQGHAAYTAACVKNEASRFEYAQRRDMHRDELQALDAQQRQYYTRNTGGYFPTAHRELKPLARELADDETDHARAREAVYSRAPTMYGTRQGQTAHERYIRDHYREADTAEMDYNIHSRFEKYIRAVSLRCLP